MLRGHMGARGSGTMNGLRVRRYKGLPGYVFVDEWSQMRLRKTP